MKRLAVFGLLVASPAFAQQAQPDQVAAVDAMVATANTAVSADGTVIAADPVVVKP